MRFYSCVVFKQMKNLFTQDYLWLIFRITCPLFNNAFNLVYLLVSWMIIYYAFESNSCMNVRNTIYLFKKCINKLVCLVNSNQQKMRKKCNLLCNVYPIKMIYWCASHTYNNWCVAVQYMHHDNASCTYAYYKRWVNPSSRKSSQRSGRSSGSNNLPFFCSLHTGTKML